MDVRSTGYIDDDGTIHVPKNGFNHAVDPEQGEGMTRQERADSMIESFTSDTEVLSWLIEYVQLVQNDSFSFKKKEDDLAHVEEAVDPHLGDVLEVLGEYGFSSDDADIRIEDTMSYGAHESPADAHGRKRAESTDDIIRSIVGQAMLRLEEGKLPIVKSIGILAEKNGIAIGGVEPEQSINPHTHG